MKREVDGKFAVTSVCYIDEQGYPRISAGPLRGQRLHRIIAEAMLGRKLNKDEDVHHRDGNKLNFSPDNLQVLGHREHGCVSASQHHYIKTHDIHLKKDWDEYFDPATSSSVREAHDR